MNIEVKPEKNKQVDIEITIDDFVVNKHLKTAATKISQSVNIPGFRKGKAPYSLIESQYGKDYILENSLDPIIQEVIPPVLDEQKLEYPCAPKVDILEREPKLKINLMVPLMPEVEVGDYKSIKTKVSKERITKKKIVETINRILESRSTWESSESKLDFPGFAKINLTASYEGKEIMNEHEFDFYAAENSNLIAPGVAENIKGISKNEKKKFTLTLPLDWKEEDLQGKNVKFEVECLDIQEKVTPKLSDEFLKEINPEIKGIKDFQDQIKKEITAENDYKYNLDLETQIIDDLIKLSKFQISEIQIQRSADLIIEDRMRSISQYRMEFDDYLKAINKSREEFYQESLESSEKELQKLLIIEEVIKLENINANKKDIDDEIKIIKEQYKDQNLADDESLKKIVENNIKRRKSVEHLINVAKSSSKNRKK